MPALDSDLKQRLGDSHAPGPVPCPICRMWRTPSALLDDGRCRCGNCGALLLPNRKARLAAPAKKKGRENEPTTLEGERPDFGALLKFAQAIPVKGLLAALGGIVGIVLLWFSFSGQHRPTLHPVRGQLLLEGRPLANASILLHPAADAGPDAVRPRAVSRADGSFALTTCNDGDGAPPGEYHVTVQCFQSSNPRDEDAPPRNLLSARFSKPETSGITVRIQAGENQLPPLTVHR